MRQGQGERLGRVEFGTGKKHLVGQDRKKQQKAKEKERLKQRDLGKQLKVAENKG